MTSSRIRRRNPVVSDTIPSTSALTPIMENVRTLKILDAYEDQKLSCFSMACCRTPSITIVATTLSALFGIQRRVSTDDSKRTSDGCAILFGQLSECGQERKDVYGKANLQSGWVRDRWSGVTFSPCLDLKPFLHFSVAIQYSVRKFRSRQRYVEKSAMGDR